MSYKGIAKVQHYVPQFLLRNFGTGKKDQVHVFNKSNDKTFVTNARNVAAESRFYDFKSNGIDISIEPILSRIESEAKPVFKKIIDTKSLSSLHEDERFALAVFLAVQFVRTKASRAAFGDAAKQFVDILRNRFGASEEQIKDSGFDLNDQHKALFAIKTVLDAPKDYATSFLSKDWLLLEAPSGGAFLMGDRPLALQNSAAAEGSFGNIGLMVPGIEVYFPITPNLAIALWCRSIGQQVLQAATYLRAQSEARPPSILSLKDPDRLLRLEASLRTEAILKYDQHNLENFNWLQIVHAESFIFSSRDDFDLVRKVIAQSESLRQGRRMRVS